MAAGPKSELTSEVPFDGSPAHNENPDIINMLKSSSKAPWPLGEGLAARTNGDAAPDLVASVWSELNTACGDNATRANILAAGEEEAKHIADVGGYADESSKKAKNVSGEVAGTNSTLGKDKV